MIFDGHCHAWRRWPDGPGVPDVAQRGSVDSLLYELDANGVEWALVVCARAGRDAGAEFSNDDNNDYVAKAVARHPDRLVMLADVDGLWVPEEYHVPGASARLRAAVDRYGLTAFTHYVNESSDGWFSSDDGMEFFATAAELGLIVSLGLPPGWQAELRKVALAFPTVPFLVHHLGFARKNLPDYERLFAGVLANGDLPNVFVKVSGFQYVAKQDWDFPYADAQETVFQPLLAAYGAERLIWGSDFPAARASLTYRQSLEVIRTHASGVDSTDLDRVLGGNLERLLASPRLGAR
jgi:predicted TIM-barrel fold metal-dependent hydrolase